MIIIFIRKYGYERTTLHLFKLSVVALAISQVQLSYAEDATLPVIKLQAESNA